MKNFKEPINSKNIKFIPKHLNKVSSSSEHDFPNDAAASNFECIGKVYIAHVASINSEGISTREFVRYGARWKRAYILSYFRYTFMCHTAVTFDYW